MTTWNPRANDLFLKALELRSPLERQQFLDGACAGDAALRAEVEALLQASDKAGSFLQFSAPVVEASLAASAPDERSGTVIGPYKLLQQIGEGGMGTVFMAEQTHPVQRKVALKVIKRGMDSSQVIARFEAERQALAMMDHVNIARVLDAGATETGRPYFVMELVHGMPITKYCDDNHLSPRERLELFVPVCQAIQHAHQKGIIHRDIKPSNVMITLYDGKPVPKVIDFGVAKATEQKLTERTLFTQYGTMVGTLEYMSPEQAEMSALGIDTRSDIYSLGVLLYELLTGSTPLPHKRLKEAAHAEIVRIIKEEDPPKPSTRLCDSGEALASISANRQMDPAKLTRLVRGELDWIVMKCLEKDRNRRYETANGFAMDVQRYLADEPVQACPPSAGYRLQKFVRRNRGPVLAAALVLFAVIAGVIGTSISTALLWREQAQTKAAIDSAQANLSLALQALEQIYIDEAEGHPRIREGLPKDLLQKGVEFYEKFVKANARDERLVSQMGTAYQRAGLIFRELGQEERAVESLEGAISAYNRAIEFDPLNSLAHCYRGSALKDLGHFEESLAAYDRAIEIDPRNAEAHNGRGIVLGEHFGRPDEALAEYARTIELSPRYGSAYSNSGLVLRRLGRFEEALAACDRAIDLYPQSTSFHNSRAAVLIDLGRFEEAVAACDRAIATYPQFTFAHLNRGGALLKLQRFQDALAAYDRALEINPRSAVFHHQRGIALHNLGRLDEALAAFDRAIGIDPDQAGAHNSRATTLHVLGRCDDALAACERAIQIDVRHIWAHGNRGDILRDLRRFDEALAAYDWAIEIDPRTPLLHNNRARVLLDYLGRPDEALAACERAIEIDPRNPQLHLNRGMVLCDHLGRPDEALAAFDLAIEIDQRDAGAHHNRSVALTKLGRFEEALAACDRVIEFESWSASAHNSRGATLAALNKFEAAIEAYAEAIRLQPDLVMAHYNLGRALAVTGDVQGAVASYREAIRFKPDDAKYHYCLGNALGQGGDHEGAIEEFREAIRIRPDYAEPHCNLGFALVKRARFSEALPWFRKGHELGSTRPDWNYPSGKWLESAERKAKMEGSLDQVVSGVERPRGAVERVAFAEMLYAKSRHAESARLYEEAFAEEAGLAEVHRYNAACSASLAAAGGEADAAEWRGRALEWLRSDLAAPEKAPSELVAMLEHWKQDPDLAAVRDGLDELPQPEREAWRSLWTEVDRALAAARTAAK